MVGTSNEMLKEAAESIRTLVSRVQELEKSAEVRNEARAVMQELINSGLVSKEDLLSKLAGLENSSLEDLKVMKKALEMGVLNSQFKLAELSDNKDEAGMSPAEKFVFNVLGIN